ncbi:hypothetical protein [Capillimicrobium parvum]|uniref:Secreted protein n=1 Tax=Capillimicrobium parvum TaxID=2884022 RepID=A0A9E7C1G5_9ACTN|nr:hypothetical protein [Capillimicrobium parvum]UGS36403.1 hypothetical protein DSM104329_02807 [Capillimicrobium parvum]
MHKLLVTVAAAAATAALIPAAASAAPITPKSRITQNGLGSMRLNMTIAQAQNRTGQRIDYQSFDPNDDVCGIGSLAPQSLGVTVLATNGRIRVINVAEAGISTRAGIEVGDRARDLRRAYGSRLRSQPSKYDPKSRDYWVTFGPRRKLVFYADGKRVIRQIAGGRTPEVDYVEGCS